MEPPPDNDPYKAVWQMSQVGDEGGHGRRIRWLAGTISGLVCLMPFALVTSVVWGFWGDDVELNGPGWAVLIIGLGAAMTVGGYVATTDN
jgi:hypothetical protein